MRLIKQTQQLARELTIASVFPITHLNASTIFESHRWLGSVIKLQGVSFLTQEITIINQLKNRLHQALTLLDEHWQIMITVHRAQQSLALPGSFQSPFAQHLNDVYFAQFDREPWYHNTYYLTVLLKGDDSNRKSRWAQWLSELTYQDTQVRREALCAELTQKIQQFLTVLSSFKPELLGQQDTTVGYSQLLCFLSLIVNGGQAIPLAYPNHCPVMETPLKKTLKSVRYPKGHLGHYVSHHQLLFGTAIQFQGAADQDYRFGAMLSIKRYPNKTTPALLDELLS